MYQLYGAIAIDALVDNTPNSISPLGEVSSYVMTFSRNVDPYSLATYADVTLQAISSKNNDVNVAVPNAHRDAVLEVSQWLYDQSIGGSLSDNKNDCLTLLTGQFTGTITITSIGDMVQASTFWLPGRLTFSVDGQTSNEITLWFSDAVARQEYPLYELAIIPPVETIDDLHNDSTSALAIINSSSNIARTATEINVAQNQQPSTSLLTVDYLWVSKADSNITANTTWTIIIWGKTGNNADTIRQEIADFILANTAETTEDWETVYPDIFRPTEFYIIPLWDVKSVEAGGGLTDVYSPIYQLANFATYQASFQSIPQAHLDSYLSVVATAYKGLAVLAVGSEVNRNNIFDFKGLWPDYTSLPTTNTDFNRISPETRDFILLLVSMLIFAESWTGVETIPSNMSIINRNSLEYVAANFDNVLYLVKTKQ